MELDSEDLGYLVEGIEQAASTKRGIRMQLVMFVPWAWQIIDGSINHYGWVVQLWDGRRIYLEYKVDKAGACSPEALWVRPFPACYDVPELSEPGIHWFEPHHVNTALRLGNPALAAKPGRLKQLAAGLRRNLPEDPDALKLAEHVEAVAKYIAKHRQFMN